MACLSYSVDVVARVYLLMIRRPPRSTRTDTLLPYTTLVRSLIQALLDAPLFPARWRWNAVTALALPRFTGGKKTPPPLQRMKSEDLLAAVFPDQVACLENIVGEREVPATPLVNQTLHDTSEERLVGNEWVRTCRTRWA